MPKISVITPVYNVAPYLPRCIDSILRQTFPDFELILINDGSTDNSGSICEEYAQQDTRIRVLHQKNQGQAAARNHALDLAQGEYIAFVDSDDWVSPEFLSVLYGNIQKCHAEIAVCGHLRTREYEIPSCDNVSHPTVWSGREYLLHCMTDGVGKHWLLWDKLFHHSCFQEVRMPIGRVHEDNATVYKLLYHAERVVDCDVPLYVYFQREGSTFHTRSWKKVSDYLLMWEEMCQYFKKHHADSLQNIAERSYFSALINCCPRDTDSDVPAETRSAIKKKLMAQKKKLAKQMPITLKTHPQYYEKLYPKRMYLYWTVQGLLNKFKR